MSSKIYFNEKSLQILDRVLEQQNDTYYKYKLTFPHSGAGVRVQF